MLKDSFFSILLFSFEGLTSAEATAYGRLEVHEEPGPVAQLVRAHA